MVFLSQMNCSSTDGVVIDEIVIAIAEISIDSRFFVGVSIDSQRSLLSFLTLFLKITVIVFLRIFFNLGV